MTSKKSTNTTAKTFLNEALETENDIISIRRYLHAHAETGFELSETVDFVKSKLKEIGCEYSDCGKSGITTLIGKGETDAVFMLRADMDALPLEEKTGLDFSCKSGNMHACGHDMHTAMLLGATRILKNHENEIKGTVKIIFQPAEEIFSGASNMIENGVLKNPDVKRAMSVHVFSGIPLKTGTVIIPSKGIGAPAADYFTVNVQGKGCHGSTPHLGTDSITVGARILLGLEEISARETSVADKTVLTVGLFRGGSAGNVIADETVLQGTLRSFSDETRKIIKKRICEIAENIGNAYHTKTTVTFENGCPTLENDGDLADEIRKNTLELLGADFVIDASDFADNTETGGSEDFSYISKEVPSVMLGLASGKPENGFVYRQHHPKVDFDESVLKIGSAVMVYNAFISSNL